MTTKTMNQNDSLLYIIVGAIVGMLSYFGKVDLMTYLIKIDFPVLVRVLGSAILGGIGSYIGKAVAEFAWNFIKRLFIFIIKKLKRNGKS